MSDEILTDNQGNPVYLSEVMTRWLDTRQAAYVMNLKSTSTVRKQCEKKNVRAKRLGNIWYVEPESAANYKKGHHYSQG